jgi:hypothetical protein
MRKRGRSQAARVHDRSPPADGVRARAGTGMNTINSSGIDTAKWSFAAPTGVGTKLGSASHRRPPRHASHQPTQTTRPPVWHPRRRSFASHLHNPSTAWTQAQAPSCSNLVSQSVYGVGHQLGGAGAARWWFPWGDASSRRRPGDSCRCVPCRVSTVTFFDFSPGATKLPSWSKFFPEAAGIPFALFYRQRLRLLLRFRCQQWLGLCSLRF